MELDARVESPVTKRSGEGEDSPGSKAALRLTAAAVAYSDVVESLLIAG